jgi:hypothetical protein
MKKIATCFLLCAWVLWQQHYINDKKGDVEILNAFGLEDDCKNSLTYLLEDQKKRGTEVVGMTVKRKVRGDTLATTLVCLPDTVKFQ